MARKRDVPVKTISLTVDHVHMPSDLTTPEWETAVDTAKFEAKPARLEGKRAKYTVHAELADFLIGRDQAMEVPADPDEGAETVS